MPNYMEPAFAAHEAHHRNIVIHQTWGHLYPDQPQYIGWVRIACGIYSDSDTAVIDEKELPGSSPWWYNAIYTYAYKCSDEMEAGEVAEFHIQVDIVSCIEELEQWQIDEEMTPDEWQEIHIKTLDKKILVKPW